MSGSGATRLCLVALFLALLAPACTAIAEEECVLCLAAVGLSHAIHNLPVDMMNGNVPNPIVVNLPALCQAVGKALGPGSMVCSNRGDLFKDVFGKLGSMAVFKSAVEAHVTAKMEKPTLSPRLPGQQAACHSLCDKTESDTCSLDVFEQRLDILREHARAAIHERLWHTIHNIGLWKDEREAFVRALTVVPAPFDVYQLTEKTLAMLESSSLVRESLPPRPDMDYASAADLPFAEALNVKHIPGVELENALMKVQKDFAKVFDQKGAAVVLDLRAVVTRMMLWRTHMPYIKPYYAIKSNPHPLVVQGLNLASKAMGYLEGMGVDCASPAEFRVAMDRHGFRASQIIYAHTLKPLDSILEAYHRGLTLMTFDTEAELLKIAAVRKLLISRGEWHKEKDFELVLRFVVENEGCTSRLGDKFGATFKESVALMEFAKSQQLNIVGLAFHVGSGGINLGVFSVALATAKSLFALAPTYGFKFRLLDMGGGWPGVDPVDPRFPTFAELAGLIRDQLKFNGFTDETGKPREGLTIIAEPGRFFSTQSMHLAVRVIARRPWFLRDERAKDGFSRMQSEGTHHVIGELRKAGRLLNPEEQQGYADEHELLGEPAGYKYTIADGHYKALSGVLLDHAKPDVFVLKREAEDVFYINGSRVILYTEAGEKNNIASKMEMLDRVKPATLFHSVIFGETCDSIDFPIPFERLLMLPRLAIGSWLFIPNLGAYNLNVWTSFNGFRDPAIIPIVIQSPFLKSTALKQRSTVLPTDRVRRLQRDPTSHSSLRTRNCDAQPNVAELLPLPPTKEEISIISPHALLNHLPPGPRNGRGGPGGNGGSGGGPSGAPPALPLLSDIFRPPLPTGVRRPANANAAHNTNADLPPPMRTGEVDRAHVPKKVASVVDARTHSQ